MSFNQLKLEYSALKLFLNLRTLEIFLIRQTLLPLFLFH